MSAPKLSLNRLAVIVLVVIAALMPLVSTSFFLFQLTMALVYGIAILGLVFQTGMNGQISLAQGAYVGIGAYTVAILTQDYHWPVLAAIGVSFIPALIIGVLVGIPSVRLKGMYLAILTMMVAVVFPLVIKRFADFTGGSSGKTVSRKLLAPPEWLPITREAYHFYILLVVVAVLMALAVSLRASSLGRAIIAIKDNQLPAATLGIDVRGVKIASAGIGAALGGLAGGCYVLSIGFVASEAFPTTLSINLLAAAVIGGMTNVWGAVIGGLVLQFLPQVAQLVNPALTALVFGVILILFMLLMPDGVAGSIERAYRRLRARFSRAARTAVVDPDAAAAKAAKTTGGAHR